MNFDLGPEARAGITVERLPPKALGVAIVTSIGTGEASDDLVFILAKSVLGRWPGVIACGGKSWTLTDAEAHWAQVGRYPWVDEANAQARTALEKMKSSRKGPFRG